MTDYQSRTVDALVEISRIDDEIERLRDLPRSFTPEEGWKRDPQVHARIGDLARRRGELLSLANTYSRMAVRQEIERLTGLLDERLAAPARPTRIVT